MNTYWIDTNIVLRFLLNDHTTHSPLARQLFVAASAGKVLVKISPVVMMEVVYVLRGVADFRKSEIFEALTKFSALPGVEVEEREIVLEALRYYKEYGKVSYGDAYIAAKTKAQEPHQLLTFNLKDFTKPAMGIRVQKLGDACDDPSVLNVQSLLS